MTALPLKLYRDPLQTLIDLEAQTCAGCIHERTIHLFGQALKHCDIRKKHGNRCRKYEPAAGSL